MLNFMQRIQDRTPNTVIVTNHEKVTAQLTGSRLTPDPILRKVHELEARGLVSEVIILESFPVQIRLRGSKQTVEDLKKFARKYQ